MKPPSPPPVPEELTAVLRRTRLPHVRAAAAEVLASPGARAFYDQRRAAGDTHNRALRALANRLVGILHGCLRHGVIYDEDTAWANRVEQAA